MKKLIVILLSVLGIVGCGRNTIPELSIEEKNEIVSDARDLLTQYGERVEIEKTEWPESFRQIEPVAVQRSYEGIVIITHKFVSSESGLFIPPVGYSPETSQSAGYEKIGDDLYYYWIPNEN